MKVAHSINFKAVIPIDSLVIENLGYKKDGKSYGGEDLLKYKKSYQDSFSYVQRPNEYAYETFDRKSLQKAVWAFTRVLTKKSDEKAFQDKKGILCTVYDGIREKFKSVVNPRNAYNEYKIPYEAIDNHKDPIARVAYSSDGRIYLLTGEDAEDFASKGKNIGENKGYYKEVKGSGRETTIYTSSGERKVVLIEDTAKEDIEKSRQNYRLSKNRMNLSPNRLKDRTGRNLSLRIHAYLSNLKKPEISINAVNKKINSNSLMITGIEFIPSVD